MTTSSSYQATCCVWGQDLSVEVSCPTAVVFNAFQEYFSSWPDTAPCTDAVPGRPLEIRIAAGGYRLAEGRRCLGAAGDLPGILAALQEWMDYEVSCLTSCTPIHAGVVVAGGRTILLPAASHAGKTTLVAALLARGAEYYSDEFALLDEDGRVHPYPRPLQMRDSREHRYSVPASTWHAPVGHGALDVGLILSLRFVADGRLSLHPVAASEAMMMLLRNTPHQLGERKALASTVLHAVRHAAAYEGVRGEAAPAADAIMQWASGGPMEVS